MKKIFITWITILNGLFIIGKENQSNDIYKKTHEEFHPTTNKSHGFFYYLLIIGSSIIGFVLLIVLIIYCWKKYQKQQGVINQSPTDRVNSDRERNLPFTSSTPLRDEEFISGNQYHNSTGGFMTQTNPRDGFHSERDPLIINI
jgi:hypothetical protein